MLSIARSVAALSCLNAGKVTAARASAVVGRRSLSDQAAEPAVVVTQPSGDNGILTIRLNKPRKLNAVDTPMYEILTRELRAASDSKDTKVVVLTGTGNYFSAGNDLSAFAKLDLSNPNEVMKFAKQGKQTLIDFVDSLIDLKKPIVAAVNGPAIGLLVTTLSLCDIIWAAEKKASFITPFSATAQSPEGVSSLTFPQILGTSLANEMLMFNRQLSAEEAHRAGFVSTLLPADDFHGHVEKNLQEILRVSSPESMIVAKALVRTDAVREQMKAVNRVEAQELYKRWFAPEFPNFIAQFMMRKSK